MAQQDVDALVAIEEACFAAGYADKMMSRQDFADVLADPNAALFCVVASDQVAGYAYVIAEGDEAHFDSLAVSPAYQGNGFGDQLFKRIEQFCAERKIPRLNLEIKETNYALLKRYHAYGYKCFEIEPGFYADGWGAIRMLKYFDV